MKFKQTEIAPGVFQVDIGWADIGVRPDDVSIRLGYPAGPAPAPFGAMIDEIFAEAPDRLDIRAGYRLLPAVRPEEKRDGLVIGGTYFHTHAIVAAEFTRAEQAAVFVCTIGSALEIRAADLTREGDPALGFIVDSAASEFAERTAAALHDHIAAVMAEGSQGVTNRYSPGYCNWDVAEQHLLFALLPAGFCGIRLSESALMLPIKSVSGIIGAGPGVERRDYRCDHCSVADCVYRRKAPLKKNSHRDTEDTERKEEGKGKGRKSGDREGLEDKK
jgi:hypothetical protein